MKQQNVCAYSHWRLLSSEMWLLKWILLARSQNCLKRLSVSLCQSICLSAWNSLVRTGRIFIKHFMWVFFESLSRELKFDYNLTRTRGPLHEDLSTFVTVSCWILLRMRNISDKTCRKNRSTRFVFNDLYKYNVYNVGKYGKAGQDTDGNIIQRRKNAIFMPVYVRK